MWRTRRERDRRRDREANTPMEGQPRVRYEWRGGKRGVGVRSSRATAAGKRPGKQRANTSGADLRASEPSGNTAVAAPLLYTVALRVLRSCSSHHRRRRRVVTVEHPRCTFVVGHTCWPTALGVRDLTGLRLAPSYGGGCDRLGGLIARRAKRGAFSRAFTGAGSIAEQRRSPRFTATPAKFRFAVPPTSRDDRIGTLPSWRSGAVQAATVLPRCYYCCPPPVSRIRSRVLIVHSGVESQRVEKFRAN